jgi:DNA replication protein DnaC
MKTAAEVCPVCAGSGWKPVPGAPDGGVTRCDCRLRERGSALIAAARIPKRYEHCELSNFEFEGPHSHLAHARMAACRFVEEYPLDKTGLMLIGNAGSGKTHLAVGIAKSLIREKGIDCVFYDYADLLKQIQDSYNPSVQTTELGLLRPVFEAEVLVLDDLGSVRPTDWRWDTVRLILNTRYNDNRTTIITTNFPNKPPAALAERRTAKADDPNATKHADGFSEPDAADWVKYTLGDRIGEPMRSRLHEMCRIVKMDGPDFRKKFKSASFG